MIRAFANLVVRLALRTFYRRIDLVGAEKLPARRPVLLVANHFNSLVDPLVIQAALPRWVTFAAAEFLFLWWRIGGVMHFPFSIFEWRRSPATG